MTRNIKIHGLVFRPCSLDFQENEERMRTAIDFTEIDFLEKYNDSIVVGQIIAESAKIFICKNWESIKDWSDLEVEILDNSGEVTEYYNYKDEEGWVGKIGNLIKSSLNKRNKERHNPATEVKDICLDPTDGDFSLTINGKEHWWIDNESVIIIADYIEQKLKK